MRITLFKDLSGCDATPVDTTWDALHEWIANAAVFPSKDAMPLIKLGAFGAVRTEKGSLRHDANLLAISGIEGDYDGEVTEPAEAVDRLKRAGITAIVYTSPSHHPDRPRWRVLAPLSKEYAPDARRGFLERINGVLDGVLSTESFTASQAFYVGRTAGADYAVLRSD